uniref:Metalloendopeptidase n=1 Tax=Parastrongyloides trichosuri TaxID=131310 RepID=A0A0N4Z871_PARTI
MNKHVFISTCIFSFFLLIHNSIITDFTPRWPYPDHIRVYISSDVSYYCASNVVEDALKEIEENTCFRFEKEYKILIEEGEGINVLWGDICVSRHIGRRAFDFPNNILVNYDCCNNYKYILGLLLQALGLDYEHNRFDRNTFIHINRDDIQANGLKYFNEKDKSFYEVYGTNYDYGSITHGWPTMFVKNNKEAITVIGNHSKIYQKMIGQKSSVSFNEYKLINYNYCNYTCINNGKPLCKNNGYQHPNYCYKCQCPYPYQGNTCESIPAKHPRCPEYNIHPNVHENNLNFWNNQKCYTFIQGDSDKLILIKIKQAHLTFRDSCGRGESMLEIKYKKDKTLMGLCFCGYVTNYEIISENSLVIIIYHGTDEAQYAQLTYRIYDKPRIHRDYNIKIGK